jgi:hypothetical protein
MSASRDAGGLVELLLSDPQGPPDDLDILTESTEQDAWATVSPSPRPDDLDIETRSLEQDVWRPSPRRGRSESSVSSAASNEAPRCSSAGWSTALPET